MSVPESAHTPADSGDIGAKLMLVLLCLVWGVTWAVMRIALDEVPPFSMRASSAALGALTLYLVCRIKGRSLRVPSVKAWLHLFIASLLNVVAFSAFGAFAQLSTSTSRVAILAYTLPIWSVLFTWLFLGERPNRTQTFALGLCAAGLAILIYPLTAHGIPVGILLALAVGVSWGAGTAYLKWARIDADPMGVASWQLTIAFFVLVICLLVFEHGLHLGAAHTDALLAIAWTGIFGNALAYGLWFTIVRRLPTTTASLGVLGSPVIGVIASVLLLGERPTDSDIVGFALILAASACVLLARPQPTVVKVATSA